MQMKEEKQKFKSLTIFHSANKINNYNRGGKKKGGKIQKNLQNKSKRKNNKCFSWVTAVRALSLVWSHRPPHLPSMSSNSVLISGPAVGAAQILICSYTSVFLPPMSTAVRASALSSVGALSDLLYVPQTQSLPSWSCGFNLQPVQLVGSFGSSSLATLPLGFICGFISTSACWGWNPACRVVHWGLPLWGPGVEVVQLPGLQGFWQHQVLRGVGG